MDLWLIPGVRGLTADAAFLPLISNKFIRESFLTVMSFSYHYILITLGNPEKGIKKCPRTRRSPPRAVNGNTDDGTLNIIKRRGLVSPLRV